MITTLKSVELTPEGQAALADAWTAGWYCRSGRPLAWLLAWEDRCRCNGRPCVVAIRGREVGTVLVDGEAVGRVDVASLNAEAGRIVRDLAHEVQGRLWPGDGGASDISRGDMQCG